MSQVVVDIFGDIVAKVSAAVTPKLQMVNPAIVGVNYLYGPFGEIVEILTQWTKSETFEPKKYPLIALIMPFNEGKGTIGFDGIDDLRFIIAGLTQQEWHTVDRYTNNLKPILYPIYDEFMNQINMNTRINKYSGRIKHTKIDWPFWDDGKGKNPFNDLLDVIEIKNTKLNILLQDNCN